MNNFCLGFRLPLCDPHGSYAKPAVDWVPLKVRMKALVEDTGGGKGLLLKGRR